ncbi:MAG: ribosome biogenesis GTP-binding protein YihA/YsxC [Clostridiales bacterium]|jgi:GTP-binding protein|nr:ribosome biogenesis GTP-binding protein YihA/YsxC [Clostridiales bacterium]
MAFKIESAEFAASFADVAAYKNRAAALCRVPQICFVGRSNAGKSSLINMLAGKKIARTSREPGRTRLINFFSLDGGRVFLADIPGYGYAKVSKAERGGWGELIEGYLLTADAPKHIFLLADARIDPAASDKKMIDFMYSNRLPFTVLAAKADKLSGAALSRSVQKIATAFCLGRDDIIAVSSVTNLGRAALLEKIGSVVERSEA